MKSNSKVETATFGAGCFWHVQCAFDKVPGVIQTEVGYMGGDEKKFPSPDYKQVCTNTTGYIEVTQVNFDPEKISYEKLLDVFWEEHDPTSKDKQGYDVGSQYRSAIFYHDEKQRELAEKSKSEKEKELDKKIVTEIQPAQTFFKAEEYHQKYSEKHGAVCKI